MKKTYINHSFNILLSSLIILFLFACEVNIQPDTQSLTRTDTGIVAQDDGIEQADRADIANSSLDMHASDMAETDMNVTDMNEVDMIELDGGDHDMTGSDMLAHDMMLTDMRDLDMIIEDMSDSDMTFSHHYTTIQGSCDQACEVYGTELNTVSWREANLPDQLRSHLLQPVAMGPLAQLTGDVALSENLAVLSVVQRASSASAFIFRKDSRDAWLRWQKVTVPTDSYHAFTPTVATDGEDVFLGVFTSQINNATDNSVYVFKREQQEFIQTQRLQVLGRGPNVVEGAGHGFGSAIDISGTHLIIGAKYEDNLGSESGAAYIYHSQTQNGDWRYQQRLEADDGGRNEKFGQAVAIDGDLAMISATKYNDQSFIYEGGQVYVFKVNQRLANWTQRQVLTPTASERFDRFGDSIMLEDGVAVISAPGLEQSGAVFIFTQQADGSWSETQRIDPPNNENIVSFGEEIALEGDVLLISDGALNATIYVYTRPPESEANTLWTLSHQINENTYNQGFEFKRLFAVSNHKILVVTQGNESEVGVHGSALILEVQSPLCNEQNQCSCLEGASGSSCIERPQMGDGILQAAERCDDGNIIDGDGCSAYGQPEAWYRCQGTPSLCSSVCFAEDLPDESYLVLSEFGECSYPVDNCDAPGVKSRVDILCQDGNAVEVEVISEDCLTNPVCLPENICDLDSDCPAGELCVCSWGGRDIDTIESCVDEFYVPKTCQPCGNFEGTFCIYYDNQLPDWGATVEGLCHPQVRGIHNIQRSACPPECSEDRPCPNAFQFCSEGRCIESE